MPKFRVRLSQTVYYEMTVEARNRLSARLKIAGLVDEGDPDVFEVDNGEFQVESVEEISDDS